EMKAGNRRIAFLMVAVICSLALLYQVQTRSLHWTDEMVRGADFESMTESGVLSMSFPMTGNFVITTIGERNGAMAGTVYEWSIDGAGILAFFEQGKKLDTFSLLSFDFAEVEVQTGVFGTTKYRRTLSAERGAARYPVTPQ
ncbi:hypothetical protein VSU19_09980, partial [Verrucomicrobiales bacterium BCK34]|nr:hypothetical protein [Verrucomicrobiales bacterium BCK34]